MSTTTTPKPSSSLLSRLPKNKRCLFFILVAVVAFLFAANSIGRAYHRFTLLHQDMMQAQASFSNYKEYIDDRLNYNENIRLAQLEQAWALSEAKIARQQETIKKLEQALAQKSDHHSDVQELKAQEEMDLQTQQKLPIYDYELLARIQQKEEAKRRAEYQEFLKKSSQMTFPQVSQEALDKDLESKLSQLAYADYELEQKLKDLQKAVESSAKIGELKALEVYYDEKFDSVNDIIKNGAKKALPQAGKESEVSQLKQEIVKLHMEKEEMKVAVNNLWNQQRKSEERLNQLIETQAPQNKKPHVQEQPQVNSVPKAPQKEVNQKAPVKEAEDVFEDLFKQFGLKVERPQPASEKQQQQTNFNQRRVNPSLHNFNPHHHNLGFMNLQPRMRHFNHDPFHQFPGFPRSSMFNPRQQRHNNHGMMDDVMFW